MVVNMKTTLVSLLLHSAWSKVGNAFNMGIRGPMHNDQDSSSFMLAGLIKDPHVMDPDTLDLIVNMNCIHNVQVHIISGEGVDALKRAYYQRVAQDFSPSDCAAFHIELEPVGLDRNRIERLSELREFQKQQIEKNMKGRDLDSSVIILADLDVKAFPSTQEVLKFAKRIASNSTDVDVLCANGEAGAGKNLTHSYYDTLATVLLPETFTHPLGMRMWRRIHPKENPNFIVGKKNFTRKKLFQWFEDEGKDGEGSEMRPVPVRSCFGGLTLYKASKFLDKRCNYFHELPRREQFRYKNKKHRRICEHVLWSFCMSEKDKGFRIAVQPDMVTTYQKFSGLNKTEEEVAWEIFLQEEKDKGRVVVEKETALEMEHRMKLNEAAKSSSQISLRQQKMQMRTKERKRKRMERKEMLDRKKNDDGYDDVNDDDNDNDKFDDDTNEDSKAEAHDDGGYKRHGEHNKLRDGKKNISSLQEEGAVKLKQMKDLDISIAADEHKHQHTDEIVFNAPGGDAGHDALSELRIAVAIHVTFALAMIGMISRKWRCHQCHNSKFRKMKTRRA